MSKSKARKRRTYDREIFAALHAFRGWDANDVAKAAGVSASTVRNLRLGPRHGGTRFPQFETITKLLCAAGFELHIVAPGEAERVVIRQGNGKVAHTHERIKPSDIKLASQGRKAIQRNGGNSRQGRARGPVLATRRGSRKTGSAEARL